MTAADDDPVVPDAPGIREAFLLHYLAVVFAFASSIGGDLRFYQYNLLTVEVGLLLLGLLLAALPLAWLAWRFQILKPLVIGFVTFIAVDSHTSIDSVYVLAAVFVGVIGIVWLLRQNCAQIVAFGLGVLTLTNLALPVGSLAPYAENEIAPGPDLSSAIPASADPPPPLVHLILDEHIGLYGLQALDLPDTEGSLSFLGNLVAQDNFQLYRGGYSQYSYTYQSLSGAFNYDTGEAIEGYVERQQGERYRLVQNRYFDALAARGYQLRVIQSSYLDFCAHAAVTHCSTYQSNTTAVLQSSDLPVTTRAVRIFAHWVTNRLAGYQLGTEIYYDRMLPLAKNAGLKLPNFDVNLSRVGPLAADSASEDAFARAIAIKPGEALFAHLFIPHYPYVYESNCQLVTGLNSWLTLGSLTAKPLKNTEQTRAQRYQKYLAQMQCLHTRLERVIANIPETAVIVLHGDHGSRINVIPTTARYVDQLNDADLVDSFSTLMAIRIPGKLGTTINGWIPLANFLEAAAESQQAGPEDNPRVSIRAVGGDKHLPLPPID